MTLPSVLPKQLLKEVQDCYVLNLDSCLFQYVLRGNVWEAVKCYMTQHWVMLIATLSMVFGIALLGYVYVAWKRLKRYGGSI